MLIWGIRHTISRPRYLLDLCNKTPKPQNLVLKHPPWTGPFPYERPNGPARPDPERCRSLGGHRTWPHRALRRRGWVVGNGMELAVNGGNTGKWHGLYGLYGLYEGDGFRVTIVKISSRMSTWVFLKIFLLGSKKGDFPFDLPAVSGIGATGIRQASGVGVRFALYGRVKVCSTRPGELWVLYSVRITIKPAMKPEKRTQVIYHCHSWCISDLHLSDISVALALSFGSTHASMLEVTQTKKSQWFLAAQAQTLPRQALLALSGDLRYVVWLVAWNMNLMTSHSVWHFIITTDEAIFFRGVHRHTTNQQL